MATVSFLNAKANRLVGTDGREPSFEAVLRTMFDAGFRGDVYTSPNGVAIQGDGGILVVGLGYSGFHTISEYRGELESARGELQKMLG